MPLFETIATTLGFAIAKSTFKCWLRDHEVLSDTSSSLVDLIRDRLKDFRTRSAAERQFGRIAEKAADSLMGIIKIEFKSLDEGSIEAALREATACIDGARIDADTLANLNVDPKRLADLLRQRASLSMFSRAEQDLFERILSESCQLIVDFAGNLPGFTERTLGEVLQRESLIMEKVDQVLTEITRVRATAVFADKASSEARFEEAYRRQVSRKLDELELYGASEIISSGSSRHHNLTLAYISLSILQKPTSHATSPTVGRADPEAKLGSKILSGGQATRVEHALNRTQAGH